jgi:hypothetical protein
MRKDVDIYPANGRIKEKKYLQLFITEQKIINSILSKRI